MHEGAKILAMQHQLPTNAPLHAAPTILSADCPQAAPGNQQPSDPEEPPDIEIGQAINDSGRREDELVTAEWQRLENGLAAADTISLQHLRKVYPGNPPKVRLPSWLNSPPHVPAANLSKHCAR